MAKKSKTAAKLPKRFAGVKIPKKVRKGPIGKFITSPAGQLVVAEVVAAAGGALLKRNLDKHPERKRALKEKTEAAGEGAADAAHTVGDAGANVTLAVTEAARTFGRVLRHGEEPEAPPARFNPPSTPPESGPASQH